MITDIRKAPPFIHFGYGKIKTSLPHGQPFRIYLESIYNNGYDVIVSAPVAAVVLKISDSEFQITLPAAGSFQLSLVVSDKDKTISIESNLLSITST